MSEHPQAAILRAIAEDKDATIQFRAPGAVEWGVCGVAYMLMHPAFIYRIAPIQPPDEDGFRPWYGGENPAPGKDVQFKMRYGRSSKGKADHLRWDHSNNASDIIAWREVPEVKQKVKKVYYLWAYPSGSVMFREEGWNSTGSSAIRLDWSRTEIEE